MSIPRWSAQWRSHLNPLALLMDIGDVVLVTEQDGESRVGWTVDNVVRRWFDAL